MKRMKVLFGNRRMMVLLTLAILVLAAAALIASSASFTSQSTNPTNTFTAAGFKISNQHEGVAVFNVLKMKPGSSDTQTWWVQLDPGSADGNVTLTLGNVQDPVVGPGAVTLSSLLRVTVVDNATGATLVNDALLSTVVTGGAVNVPGYLVAAPAWTDSEQHSFTVTVRWPNGASAVDNLRKGCQSTFDITWDAVSI